VVDGSPFPLRVLIVAHGHPALHVGGGEKHAYSSFLALSRRSDVTATYLFVRDGDAPSVGSWLRRVEGDVWSFADSGSQGAGTHYQDFGDRRILRADYRHALASFLRLLAPHVVHVHHYYRVGWDVVALARDVLADAVILVTLHDYKLLCPGNGHLVKRHRPTWSLCEGPNLKECGACCPGLVAEELLAREASVRGALHAVDRFIVPSWFAARLYRLNGLAPDQLVVLENGYAGEVYRSGTTPTDEVLRTFGYFGRSAEIKGITVLIEATRRAVSQYRTRLVLHVNGPASAAVERARGDATIRERGEYDDTQLPQRLMDVGWVVVPSLWWENAPLVVDEARATSRPVICSDIGALRESIRPGVDGLVFPMGDSAALARLLADVAGDAVLWQNLSGRGRPPRAVSETTQEAVMLYMTELRRKRSCGPTSAS
jgi:glycosyltransferase involved in cell wall biosynthesis